MFVYIHFNVPPTRKTDLVKMYQMKRFIDMEQSPLSMFCFYQLGSCSVSYTANEYSIYHFCIMIKDFSISFSRVIIVQDFETVRPGFHYTANATTTTQKQSDYRVEQSSFTLIALFWPEIGRCRDRNWLMETRLNFLCVICIQADLLCYFLLR